VWLSLCLVRIQTCNELDTLVVKSATQNANCVSSKRSKRRERNVYKKTHTQCTANREKREREREREKERKIKEFGNCLPHTRYAPSTPRPPPAPNSLSPQKNKKTRKKITASQGPSKTVCANLNLNGHLLPPEIVTVGGESGPARTVWDWDSLIIGGGLAAKTLAWRLLIGPWRVPSVFCFCFGGVKREKGFLKGRPIGWNEMEVVIFNLIFYSCLYFYVFGIKLNKLN